MRRARSPMVRQRPLTFCSIALLLVVSLACNPHVSLAAEEHTTEQTHKEARFQAAKQLIAAVSAPAPSIELVAIAPAPADEAAVATAPAPAVPQLPGISFLGLPAVPLPYKDYSAVAPSAESSVQAPAPAQASGDNALKSFVSSFIDEALPPVAKPLAGAAVLGAPLPSASSFLASLTQAIPAEAPAPAAALKVNNAAGNPLVNVPIPNVQSIFSVLEKLGRRRLLADGAPALAPGPQPGGAFPALVNLEVGGNQANPNADDSFAESQWYKTTDGPPGQPDGGPQLQAQPQPLPQMQPGAQLQAQPQPQPQPQGQPQPLQNVEVQTQETAIGGLPAAVAQAPVGAQPGQPQPQPGPLAPSVAPGLLGSAPGVAPAPRAFGPIPSEVKVFTEKLVNFLSAEARSQLPKRIEVNAGAGRRRLAQDSPGGALPLPAEPLAAEAPMAAPGGLPGPQFQALPEPAPLPPLPRPSQQLQMTMPDEASSMAPMAAPAGEASAQYQARPVAEAHHHHMSYTGTFTRRRLQQGPPGTVPEGVEATEPYAAMTPMAAPGALPQPGPAFQALPEPAPLPPLPRPAPQLQTMPAEAMAAMAPMSAMAGEAQPGAQYQARPAESKHHHMSYTGTFTGRRHLAQDPRDGPPGTVPEGIAATQPTAAMTPMSAPGGLPGPTFQALPEPAPLPPLPRPAPQLQTMPAEAMAAMAPMSAVAGEAQPGAQLQARPAAGHHHHMSYIGTNSGRRLQQGPPGTIPEEATEPFAAMTPMAAPGALPQPGPAFQALPEPAPLPPLPRPAPQLQTMPAEAMAAMAPMSAMAGEAQPGAQLQARPAEGHHHHMSYIGTNSGRRHLAQDPLADGPPGTVPEQDVEISDTQADAAMVPMPMNGMPQPGPQFQALPRPGALPDLPRPASHLQQRPVEAPEGAPAGEAQPATVLLAKTPKANKNPQGENHVNPAAKITTASTATTVPAAANIKTTAGRKLQATAPAPAPEQGPAARRDMPPLPPVGPGMTANAQAPQPGAPQGGPAGVGVFQANDPNNSEAPALQVPKEYETGLINAFKQAIPQYISNALATGR